MNVSNKEFIATALEINVTPDVIAEAIDRFNPGYHQDFFIVQVIAEEFFIEPSMVVIEKLGYELRNALGNWGAGCRKAPRVVEIRKVIEVLSCPDLQAELKFFKTYGLNSIESYDGQRHIELLNTLSKCLFVDNRSVTYPMKAHLLLTGYMPALDGRVRAGLGKAGFTGINKTQYFLPNNNLKNADYLKVVKLPVFLSECFVRYRELLDEAVEQSSYKQLINYPGRLLDVLLFMQGASDKDDSLDFSKIFINTGKRRNWYK